MSQYDLSAVKAVDKKNTLPAALYPCALHRTAVCPCTVGTDSSLVWNGVFIWLQANIRRQITTVAASRIIFFIPIAPFMIQ